MAEQPGSGTQLPRIEFPEDPELPDLANLFDVDWVWRTYCEQHGATATEPEQVRVRQFGHNLSRIATASYDVQWPEEEYLPSRHLVATLERGRPVEFFEFPEDASLPGLSQAVHPHKAVELINKHVLAYGARRVLVQVVRYRPRQRAVLRHNVGKVRLFARVMRPSAVPQWLTTWELVTRSEFSSPRLAGCWEEGGVVWMSAIPGRNMRQRVMRGRPPDPAPILDGLESLWNDKGGEGLDQPFNLNGAYQRARRSFRRNLQPGDSGRKELKRATEALDPFVEGWKPTTIAHNDFYDDQMIVAPDGRIFLVDFEEAGPGDPMLDVGNFLSHLNWATRFARDKHAAACGAYYETFRQAALARFGWIERELALREAVCIFRSCTNVIRHPQPDWRERLEKGLRLVNETLG